MQKFNPSTERFFEIFDQVSAANPEQRAYIQYMRAESIYNSEKGQRKYKNWASFRAVKSRRSRQKRDWLRLKKQKC